MSAVFLVERRTMLIYLQGACRIDSVRNISRISEDTKLSVCFAVVNKFHGWQPDRSSISSLGCITPHYPKKQQIIRESNCMPQACCACLQQSLLGVNGFIMKSIKIPNVFLPYPLSSCQYGYCNTQVCWSQHTQSRVWSVSLSISPGIPINRV